MPKAPAKSLVSEAIAELDGVRRQWLRRPGVNAVDVGFKIKNGKMTDDVALRVHVDRKLPAAELSASEVFNTTGKKTETVGKFPVDVIEATYGPSATSVVESPTALDDLEPEDVAGLERTSVYDPLIGGISCGNPRVTAGTIGAIVFDRSNCKPMILSNWHVLAGASAAMIGEHILQPGPIDGGTEVVAELTRMRLNSSMDAAVATLNGARGHTRDILGLNPITGTSPATLGLNVVKSGRSTGVTEGIVDGVSMSVSINYGDPGVVSFTNQIRIVPRPPWPGVDYEVSIGGDSGSVWMTENGNRAIGLHFAGETNPMPTSENAICSPIDPITAELNFSFLPVFCPILPKPPVFDLFPPYPWICRGLVRWPLRPFPDPGPVFDHGDRFRGYGGGGASRQMGQQPGCKCNCNCNGKDEFDEEDLEMIMAMIAEYMDRRR